MAIILHALNGVLIVVLMIACGFYLERRGWFSEDGITLLSRLVNQLCLPTYMVANLLRNFSHDQLLSMGRGVALPFLSMLAGYFISKGIARLARIPEARRGIFVTCLSFSNVIFIGLPLGLALFGEAGVPYIMLYYMANTTLFWTLGVHELASSAGTQVPLFSKQSLRQLLSAPLLGFLLGVSMVLLGVSLPGPVLQACAYMGSCTSPLAMLFIGIAMSKAGWREIKVDWQLVLAMLGRFLVCPLILMAMLPHFNLEPLMGQVFLILAAMPTMANTSIVTKYYGGDYQYAAMLTVVSTLLAAGVIPFYMWLSH